MALLLAALTTAGCVVATPSPNDTIAEDQVNGGCPVVTPLTGGGGTGAPCVTADADCAPFCCTCPNGDGLSYLASECSIGSCTDPATACDDVARSDPSLCP